MQWLSGRLHYSNVMSTIAVFIALGGASYAAVTLPKNSIGTKQIKNGQIKHADLGKNAVTSINVKDGSLLSTDFKPGQLPQGPKGDKGDTGLQGPAGTNGTNGANGATNVVVRQGALISVADNTNGIVTASCHAGERATGGGSSISGSTGWSVIESFPTPGTDGATPTGWRVDAHNATGSANNLVAIVVCASP